MAEAETISFQALVFPKAWDNSPAHRGNSLRFQTGFLGVAWAVGRQSQQCLKDSRKGNKMFFLTSAWARSVQVRWRCLAFFPSLVSVARIAAEPRLLCLSLLCLDPQAGSLKWYQYHFKPLRMEQHHLKKSVCKQMCRTHCRCPAPLYLFGALGNLIFLQLRRSFANK